LLATLALAQLSCASTGMIPATQSMPAARAALPPEERFFYDALADDGEWLLIEPYGYVFRPRANYLSWRPYEQGFWVPSDIYGWTWVSTEPFGWATYHYGEWFYDRFEGWVWIPGTDWGPAWVAWQEGDGYVGWAPIGPPNSNWYSNVPGGPYLYVPASQMVATDLSAHLMHANQLTAKNPQFQPVQNYVDLAGMRINRGPALEDIERAVGHPVRPVQIDDLFPRLAPDARRDTGPDSGRPRSLRSPMPMPLDSIAALRRAAHEAALKARSLAQTGGSPPERVSLLRVLPRPPGSPAHRPRDGAPLGKGNRDGEAPADSSR
jgi:hypothetical protein